MHKVVKLLSSKQKGIWQVLQGCRECLQQKQQLCHRVCLLRGGHIVWRSLRVQWGAAPHSQTNQIAAACWLILTNLSGCECWSCHKKQWVSFDKGTLSLKPSLKQGTFIAMMTLIKRSICHLIGLNFCYVQSQKLYLLLLFSPLIPQPSYKFLRLQGGRNGHNPISLLIQRRNIVTDKYTHAHLWKLEISMKVTGWPCDFKYIVCWNHSSNGTVFLS